MVYACLFCLLCLVLSLICSRQNLFAPAVLVSGLWFVCTFLYMVVDHGLNPIRGQFPIGISFFVGCFTLASLFMQSLKVPVGYKNIVPSQIARDIYFYFSLITLPLLLYDVYGIIIHGGVGNVFSQLRIANVKGFTSSFFQVFWLVAYLMELLCYSKEKRFRVIMLALINISYVFISMSKMNLTIIIVATAFVLYSRGIIKLKIRTILIGIMLLFAFFLAFQTWRTSSQTQAKSFISLYLLSSMPAFETVLPETTEHWGENTFRFFYAANYKLGLGDIEPVDPILPFIHVPVLTNVYTVLYPFYKDFGLYGVIVFALFLGAFFGRLFKFVQSENLYAVVLYGLLLYCLFMQFMNEAFFTMFSQNLQYIIVAFIPFFITKHHLFEGKNK